MAGNLPLDGGSGLPSVTLTEAQQQAAKALMARTMSNPESDPVTGAELGSGQVLEDLADA